MTHAAEATAAGCFVCRKHRDRAALMPGGAVAEDELTLVSHIVTPDVLGQDGSTAYLGHLVVEPRRHAPGLADLTDAEARNVGLWCTRASRALRDQAWAEHVYAAVVGDGVPHLHIHLIPRFAGTPREYWWTRVDEWPQARRGGVTEISDLVADLRSYLVSHDPAASALTANLYRFDVPGHVGCHLARRSVRTGGCAVPGWR